MTLTLTLTLALTLTCKVDMVREKLPGLITTKPVVYLVNMSSTDFLRKKNKWGTARSKP